MQTVILDFNTRVEEVNKYFNFLKELTAENTKLTVLEENGDQTIKPIDPELVITLKANGFLLLYNLVESTMRNAIEAIFEELKSRRVSFDSVRIEVKKIVLYNFKNRSPDDVHSRITDISTDIIKAGFNRRKLFSGNVNRDKIAKTAREYGFSCHTDYTKTKHGENLDAVMEKRNDLAHGNKSFASVGRTVTIGDIVQIKDEVVEYLRQILINIENYLDNQEYLHSDNR
ncbi:MAE_28990/MAE_18760 family HEPN-like nuclease [Anabaena sp. AL93]|jgi:hypothetical protein|uniref:MAE_28990/MAE_18760 family HEPN-like nuclease n=1 Tax=Anabaena sp. AL93 TaxID=1678133 RepID=UPI0007FBF268|nr:MAE_28990/MAE_18760 family HEPN-like nuclease [Anabaena sp. AL93]OBQ20824.1 MAG: hypothetical protein AN486_05745 [Anabaena sp. AL93]